MRTLFLIMSRGGGVSAVKFNLNTTPRASSDVRFQALLEKCGIAKTRLSQRDRSSKPVRQWPPSSRHHRFTAYWCRPMPAAVQVASGNSFVES